MSIPTASTETTMTHPEVRPFRVNGPHEELADLRRRVAATRWPDRETVADRSQGVRLEKLQELVRYWGTDYDWRKAEAKLNALPQFITTIDGLDIHFLHVRSRHPDALPLIMTHGWPGSVFELFKVIEPLTDPTAHGGRAEDAFHLVLPSMPGYGFSARPQGTGWGPARIGQAWDELMRRLGYARYVSQGETGARSSRTSWRPRRRPGWPASTSTCRRPCPRRSPRPSWKGARHRPDCQTRRRSPTRAWTPCTSWARGMRA